MADKAQTLASAWESILGMLGYDLNDPHLRDSPQRIARFMLDWHMRKLPELTVFPNEGYDQLVTVSGLRFHSMCAHHALPFFGQATVGYIPDKHIVGLSKIARVVSGFARRFQTQEQLTQDIAAFLNNELCPVGVGVVLRAEHLCMSMRGIERPGHCTVTSALLGAFRARPEARAELLSLVRA